MNEQRESVSFEIFSFGLKSEKKEETELGRLETKEARCWIWIMFEKFDTSADVFRANTAQSNEGTLKKCIREFQKNRREIERKHSYMDNTARSI